MTKIFFNGGDGDAEVKELHIQMLGEDLMMLKVKTEGGSTVHIGYFKEVR